MKPAKEWTAELAALTPDPKLTVEAGRGGAPTLTWDGTYLHSRYRPEQEAKRFIDSADLDYDRPILVVGLGLGYHIRELLQHTADIAVVEPHAPVAKAAVEGPMKDSTVLLGVGPVDIIAEASAFRAFAERMPQILIHPATARVADVFTIEMTKTATDIALRKQRLGVAIVGPMFGGSLPIAGYLEQAFKRLDHRTLLLENAAAWPLYQAMTNSLRSKNASNQLGEIMANALNEWTYARTMEFSPDIVIALAQAPINPTFMARMADEGIVTAFWFVENWRHMDYWQSICADYDYFFHIQPGEFEEKLTAAGCANHAFVQTACDPEVLRPQILTADEQEEYGCDISFAGAGYANRLNMLSGLTDYDFKLWGVDWNHPELLPLVQNPGKRFTGDDFSKICAASKINLNLHSSTTHHGIDPDCDALNPRVFDIAASGGFQLCDDCKGLDQHFDTETEVPVYRTMQELRDRIDHFLAHPEERAACADRARKHVLAEHTYEHRAQQMLDLILDAYGGRILRKGVQIQRTMAEMADCQGKDSALGAYLASLPPDEPFNQETVNTHIAMFGDELGYSEQVFAFLREMRNFSEGLLAEREG
jgi:spore maturation protein CgeB